MSRFTWLSFPLGMNDPRPPAIPPPDLSPLYTIEKDGANVQILRAANHTGTHVDAPRHVIADGLRITDFSPEEFLFPHPVVVDLPLGDGTIVTPEHLELLTEKILPADLALFRFGYGAARRKEPARFSTRCPGFGIEGARWLRERFPRLRAIGMDVPSLACIASLEETMASHHELLGGSGRRFLVIEDMHLDQDLSDLREVRLNPWLVEGMDSGPCSVVGLLG
jgi:arylformamidase